jgi:hypothetical protein
LDISATAFPSKSLRCTVSYCWLLRGKGRSTEKGASERASERERDREHRTTLPKSAVRPPTTYSLSLETTCSAATPSMKESEHKHEHDLRAAVGAADARAIIRYDVKKSENRAADHADTEQSRTPAKPDRGTVLSCCVT